MCLLYWHRSKIDVHRELLAFGKSIGQEFATENYCKNKVKHIETYHKKKGAISNEAMIEFLEIKEEELYKLTAIKPGREKQRALQGVRRQEKKIRPLKW